MRQLLEEGDTVNLYKRAVALGVIVVLEVVLKAFGIIDNMQMDWEEV